VGIVQGSDGNMWLTESATGANRVAALRFTYPLTATDVTGLSTSDGIRYQTQPWLPTASTSTFAQALTLAPAAAIIPAGGAAITSVRVVLNYQAPPVTAGQSNTSAGLQVGISNDSGATFTYYPLPNPQQASPACPSPGGGATESCTFTSPSAQVVLGVPAAVIGTPAQLAGLLVQVRAAPGTGSAFTLAVDLAHVDVN
jgi:hypothetical protein